MGGVGHASVYLDDCRAGAGAGVGDRDDHPVPVVPGVAQLEGRVSEAVAEGQVCGDAVGVQMPLTVEQAVDGGGGIPVELACIEPDDQPSHCGNSPR